MGVLLFSCCGWVGEIWAWEGEGGGELVDGGLPSLKFVFLFEGMLGGL